jgi:hypothetical protein
VLLDVGRVIVFATTWGDFAAPTERRFAYTAWPVSVRYMIPFAERWGIGDDVERDVAVENASEAERSELIEQVAVAPGELWSWLGE